MRNSSLVLEMFKPAPNVSLQNENSKNISSDRLPKFGLSAMTKLRIESVASRRRDDDVGNFVILLDEFLQ